MKHNSQHRPVLNYHVDNFIVYQLLSEIFLIPIKSAVFSLAEKHADAILRLGRSIRPYVWHVPAVCIPYMSFAAIMKSLRRVPCRLPLLNRLLISHYLS